MTSVRDDRYHAHQLFESASISAVRIQVSLIGIRVHNLALSSIVSHIHSM